MNIKSKLDVKAVMQPDEKKNGVAKMVMVPGGWSQVYLLLAMHPGWSQVYLLPAMQSGHRAPPKPVTSGEGSWSGGIFPPAE